MIKLFIIKIIEAHLIISSEAFVGIRVPGVAKGIDAEGRNIRYADSPVLRNNIFRIVALRRRAIDKKDAEKLCP